MQGPSRRARLNTAFTLVAQFLLSISPVDVSEEMRSPTHSFSPSPTYMSLTSLGWRFGQYA